MANVALRQALAGAGLTVRDLASACGVDEKTAGRWLTDDARLPHPRHRWAAADRLGVGEDVLWPDAVRRRVKVGADREIVAAYPTRNACPRTVWAQLIAAATNEITFAGYTNYFIWLEQPRLRDILQAKAEQGCQVRFLLGDPNGEVTRAREAVEQIPLTVSTRIRVTLDELAKLQGVEGIETRFCDQHIALSVFTFDRDMIVCQHIGALVGHDSPTLHLRRRGPDGLYDRYATHVAWLWANARPAVQ